MTIWEFRNLQNGWRKAQGGDGGDKPPTEEEYANAMERLGGLI